MDLRFKSIVIYVKNVKKSIEFYERVFELRREFLDEEAMYSEVAADTIRITFIKEDYVKKHIIKNGFHVNHIEKMPAGFELAFSTNEVEKTFRKAVEEGAYIISKPTIMPSGQIVGYVRDLDGIIIEISNDTGDFE